MVTQGNGTITHETGELKYIYKKLFYFSIHLPKKYTEIKFEIENEIKIEAKKRMADT